MFLISVDVSFILVTTFLLSLTMTAAEIDAIDSNKNITLIAMKDIVF